MHFKLRMITAIAGSFLLGAVAIQVLHAQAKPPAYVVAEVNVKDRAGYEANFLKSTKTDISQHAGKYLAGGYDKTLSLVGAEPPNRVILLQFPNMDAVDEWRKQGEEDMENTVGGKYATFRIYAVEGIAQ
jgi:uncharacterized protein (DUF1330 family)